MEWNVTNVTSTYVNDVDADEITSIAVAIPTTSIPLQGAFVLIALFAIFSNSIALYVLSCSHEIRRSKPYVLLANQCLLDGASGVFTIVCLVCVYLVKRQRMNIGTTDWFICSLLHSQLGMAIPACGSSYNLGAMALERMVSVLCPVYHRNRVSNKALRWVSASTWIVGAGFMTPLALLTNGIAPNGQCYYWNGLPERFKLTLSVCFNASFSIIPFLVMLISYAVMFIRIARLKLKVRMTVIRVLASCVVLFFVCHCLRVVFSIVSRAQPNRPTWLQQPIYPLALTLIQANCIVNPIVYCVQYTDYRKELVKQFKRIYIRGVADGCSNEGLDGIPDNVANLPFPNECRRNCQIQFNAI